MDDLAAPVAAQPEPEVEAATEPFDEGDLAVAIEVPQRRRHLAFPRELHRPQRGEKEEGDGEDEDESQERASAPQDSTR